MEDAMNMNRRKVLRWAGSGIAIAFAGCNAASSGSTNPTTAKPNTTARTTDSEPATETAGPVEIVASEFKRVRTIHPPDDVVWGKLKNTGKQYISTLEVEASFRSEAGKVLTTTTASIDGFEPGGVWEPYLQSFEFPEQVATGELAVKTLTTGPPPDKPDTAAVLPESLRPLREEFKQPTAVGEVKNIGETTLDRIEALVRFYATNGVLLDTGSSEIVEFGPGEVREFEIEFSGYEELAAPRVTSYDVSLSR